MTRKHISQAVQIIILYAGLRPTPLALPPLSFIFLWSPTPWPDRETTNHLFGSWVNRLCATVAWKSGSVWHRRNVLSSDKRVLQRVRSEAGCLTVSAGIPSCLTSLFFPRGRRTRSPYSASQLEQLTLGDAERGKSSAKDLLAPDHGRAILLSLVGP
jgi:hypothetical protein